MNLSSSPELYPKKILLGLQEGLCNLKCPKCHTHGETVVSSNDRSSGVMDLFLFKKLVEEMKVFKPRVAPQTWDEPLLTPGFVQYLEILKQNDLVVTMDTNGLLLTKDLMEKLIELKIDSIFISLDAYFSATYVKVRGVDRLDELRSKVLTFLDLRGEREFPRLGVSFVTEKSNRDELETFVDFWKDKVDVVRVNEKFLEGRKIENFSNEHREACWSLYDSLMIHHNGEAALCCVDNHYENSMGNVFQDGLLTVWNNQQFSTMRRLHESGQWEKTGICEQCHLWSNEKPVVRETATLLISETKTHRYYNQKERMHSLPKGNRYLS